MKTKILNNIDLIKKLLAILVLSILSCNVGFAQCIEGDCENGYGIFAAEGNKYIGKFKDGLFHGQGTAKWSNGTKYVGKWKNGKKHGKGTMSWKSGTLLGKWENGFEIKSDKVAKVSWDESMSIPISKKKYIFDGHQSLKKKLIKKKDSTTFKELKFILKTENKVFQGFQGLPIDCEDCNKFEEIIFDAYTFHALYENDNKIIFLVNTEYKSFKKAKKLALKYAKMMGQLPAFLRESGIDQIVIHPGKRNWLVYRQEITIYDSASVIGIAEMFIHEITHVTLHFQLVNDIDWKAAVDADGKYITKYARSSPWEDAAETVLFWVAARCNDKIKKKTKKKIIEGIPNRIAYLDEQNFDTYPMICE